MIGENEQGRLNSAGAPLKSNNCSGREQNSLWEERNVLWEEIYIVCSAKVARDKLRIQLRP
eukprot:4090412-Pyramimonas_sp.AAC.1